MKKRTEKPCEICGKIMYLLPSRQTTKFCSKICQSEFYKTSLKGKNNPNYGNKWNDDSRKKASEMVIKRFEENPELRFISGTANRGKKFSKERIEKMHGNRDSKSYTRSPEFYTKEMREKMGRSSAQRFIDDPLLIERIRTTRETSGLQIPKNEKSDYQIYYKEADWIDRMFDIIQEEKQIKLLQEFKVYNSYTNTKGVVRDHILGRRSGFENGIFPEIMRHPCNCQIITHAKNISKKKFRYVDRDDHSMIELFNKIKNYKGDWKEHEKCLFLINQYETGKRWIRNSDSGG